jgi:phosphopantothenoylcysteine decarboxylase
MGDPVEHIVLRDWATLCVIAPLSAHSLAKFSHGLCDDTLSGIVRAWPFGAGKPLVLAPAMNVAMWEHPLTAQQLNQLVRFGTTASSDGSCCVYIISPQEKMLACGEIGIGAMADVSTIVDTISRCLDIHRSK